MSGCFAVKPCVECFAKRKKSSASLSCSACADESKSGAVVRPFGNCGDERRVDAVGVGVTKELRAKLQPSRFVAFIFRGIGESFFFRLVFGKKRVATRPAIRSSEFNPHEVGIAGEVFTARFARLGFLELV